MSEELNNNTVTERYDEIKLLVESIENDALKAQSGNKTAALRLRKSLRLVKTKSADLIKFTLNN